ncbi:hypothetical protein [Polynucleobacter necessarius]
MKSKLLIALFTLIGLSSAFAVPVTYTADANHTFAQFENTTI